MTIFKRIVTAVDFSEVSNDLVRYAIMLAAADEDAELHLLHVVPGPLQRPWTIGTVAIDSSRLEQEWIADAYRRLGNLRTAAALDADAVSSVVRVGSPAETIATYASEVGADLIVLGTHGYGTVRHFMLGSVADRVLRLSRCPVLTIPPVADRPHTSMSATATSSTAAR